MSLIKLPGLLLVFLLFSHCSKEVDYLFKMEYSHQFELNPNTSPFATHFFTFENQPTNVADNFSKNNMEVGQSSIISPSLARLSTVFQSNSLIFIRNVEVGFFTTDCGDPTDFQLAFYREDIQSTQNGGLDLFPSLLNFQEELSADKYNLCVKLQFYNSPPELMDIRLDMDFGILE